MTNYELIKDMTVEEMAKYIYIHISKKGLAKTRDWLNEEAEE